MFKHVLTLLLLKIPLQLIGLIVLLPTTYFYKMGSLPKYLRWFDDARGIKIREGVNCRYYFGLGHCSLYKEANTTWLGRYNWLALRNAVNYFQTYILGKDQDDESAWQVFKYIDIPKTQYQLRVRVGYKVERELGHRKKMQELNIPAQWVFSISLRNRKKQ